MCTVTLGPQTRRFCSRYSCLQCTAPVCEQGIASTQLSSLGCLLVGQPHQEVSPCARAAGYGCYLCYQLANLPCCKRGWQRAMIKF